MSQVDSAIRTLSTVFSTDLLKETLKHLDFLEEVSQLKFDFIRAVYRYEKFWIPFYLKHRSSSQNKLYPPTDVAFIWHCHMLSPTNYEQDCIKLCSEIIDYQLLTPSERLSRQSTTKPFWESNLDISFDFTSSQSVNQQDLDSFNSSFEYDLVEAAKRQSTFYYQVSLPHYKSVEFLTQALNRYKKFLHLKVLNPKSYIVPCYAIDLIWHTHQLLPVYYVNDTKRITG